MELGLMFLCGAILFVVITIFFRAARIANRSHPKRGSEPDDFTARHAAESLSELVRFRTVKGAKGSYDAFRRLEDYLRKRYRETFEKLLIEEVDGHLLLRWSGTNEDLAPILFCTNTDVVTADGNWEFDAFSGEIAEKKIWGRGVIESKGVLCALLEAINRLNQKGFSPKRDIYISIVHDAETANEGEHKIAELVRKRGIRFDAVFGKGSCISRDLLPVSRPQAFIGVAEKGLMKVRLSATDKGGRVGMPPKYTAIGRLSEAICRIEYRFQPVRKSMVLRDMIAAIAPYLPLRKRILAANLWLFEGRFLHVMSIYPKFSAMLRTTFASTMVKAGSEESVLPSNAEATVQIRTIHGDSCSDICRFLVSLVDNIGVRVEVDYAEEASPISSYTGQEYLKLKKVLSDCFGDLIIAPAVISDHSTLNQYSQSADAVYRITPFILTEAEKATIHSTNERIGVEALGKAVEFYKKLIESVAN